MQIHFYKLGRLFKNKGLINGDISHVAISMRTQKFGSKLTIWDGRLPPQVIVDETWVKVGGKASGFMQAVDLKTWQVIYIEPCFQRDGLTAQQSIEHIHETYGEWPEEVVTDGGSC